MDVMARQGVQFVTSVILARLLAPSDFGIIALVSFFSSLAQVLLQGGLSTALVQRHDTTRAEESAAFWVNLIGSVALACVLIGGAPAIAAFYQQPVLLPLMLVAGAQVVLTSAGAVHAALLSRELAFRALAKVGIASSLLSGAVGLGAAISGAGVWALAAQGTVAAAAYSAGLWLVSDWRPTLRFRISELRRLFGFGAWLSVASILDVVYTQGFSLLVGKLHGVRELGLYNRASSTQLLPSTVFSLIISRVALPLFVPRVDDRDATQRGMRMAIGFAMLINVPVMVGLAVIPHTIIEVLFGKQWIPAAPILGILAIGGLFYPMHVINLHVLLAQGDSQKFLRIEIAKKAVGIVLVVIGSIFGIYGLAWSQVLASAVSLLFNAGANSRSLQYGPGRQLADLAGVFCCSAAMGAVTWVASRYLLLAPLAEVAVIVPISAATYFGCGFVLRIRSFIEAWSVVMILLKGRGSQPAAA
ncbi:lipopolysaccharide biosynthesis protein [Sphingomonas sp. IC-56]|uniref:lipopolysaccharide biosynthesis protein n=1 Tax=Sphingomonas sp. IC-56 TaxID=2898529 RepID=UPI002EDB5D5E